MVIRDLSVCEDKYINFFRNIFICADDHLKLGDLGISKLFDNSETLQSLTQQRGTVRYLINLIISFY